MKSARFVIVGIIFVIVYLTVMFYESRSIHDRNADVKEVSRVDSGADGDVKSINEGSYLGGLHAHEIAAYELTPDQIDIVKGALSFEPDRVNAFSRAIFRMIRTDSTVADLAMVAYVFLNGHNVYANSAFLACQKKGYLPLLADAVAHHLKSQRVNLTTSKNIAALFWYASDESRVDYLEYFTRAVNALKGDELVSLIGTLSDIGFGELFTAPYVSEAHRSFVLSMFSVDATFAGLRAAEAISANFDPEMHLLLFDTVVPEIDDTVYRAMVVAYFAQDEMVVEWWNAHFGFDPLDRLNRNGVDFKNTPLGIKRKNRYRRSDLDNDSVPSSHKGLRDEYLDRFGYYVH